MAFTIVHYDDSGTDPNQKIAVAACYVATPEQWTEFCRNWDEIDHEEHFGIFHMAEFAANQKGSPFEVWDEAKKNEFSENCVASSQRGQKLALPEQYPRRITTM